MKVEAMFSAGASPIDVIKALYPRIKEPPEGWSEHLVRWLKLLPIGLIISGGRRISGVVSDFFLCQTSPCLVLKAVTNEKQDTSLTVFLIYGGVNWPVVYRASTDA